MVDELWYMVRTAACGLRWLAGRACLLFGLELDWLQIERHFPTEDGGTVPAKVLCCDGDL